MGLLGDIILAVGGIALKAMGESSNSKIYNAADKISGGLNEFENRLEKVDADYRKRAKNLSDEQLERGIANAENSRVREIFQQELDSRR